MSFRAGFVGLIGNPNAGKSTLVNAFLGEKLSIVTQKPQTTRKRVIGMHSDSESQIIFVDAPGYIEADSGLNKFLHEEYKKIIEDSDALVAVLNIDEKNPDKLEKIISSVSESGKPWIAVITKNDLPQYHRIGLLKEKLAKFKVSIFSISATKAPKNVKEDLLEAIREILPESPGPLYDPEQFTTMQTKEMVEEYVREKCFEYLHQEIPYGLAVQVRKFEDKSPKIIRIFADIIISKESHKSMVVGGGGKRIKQIGTEARLEIEKLLGVKVYLELHVSVKKNWVDQENLMKELGYVVREK